MDSMAILEFESLFPGEKPNSLEEYLHGGDKEIILKLATLNLRKTDDFQDTLKTIFGPYNANFVDELYDQIDNLNSHDDIKIILNPWSSLKLFERQIPIPENAATQTDEEFEKNVLKGYLVLNSELTRNQSQAGNSVKDLNIKIRLPAMYFCMHFLLDDKVNYNIHDTWITQSIKAIYLFNFMESNPALQLLLTKLLEHFGQPNWREYLKETIHLAALAKDGMQDTYNDIVIENNNRYEVVCSFLEKLAVNESDCLEAFDFLTTRSKPFYKVDEGRYRIIFTLFVVEKIFTGQYFILRDINDTLLADKVPNLRGLFTDEFSEHIMLYLAVKAIYPNKGVQFTGEAMKPLLFNAEPDFYLRKGNNILLFESKDFLISANIKESCDFNKIEPALKKTLYGEIANGKQKNGAILQLINNIKRILMKEFTPDTNYKYRDVYIYPIIITHHSQYDTHGLNMLAQIWFSEEIKKIEAEGIFVNRIKPLTIINIDSLLLFENGLRDNIYLHDAINMYHEDIKILPGITLNSEDAAKEYVKKPLTAFSNFISSEFKNRGLYTLPKALDNLKMDLFADETDLN